MNQAQYRAACQKKFNEMIVMAIKLYPSIEDELRRLRLTFNIKGYNIAGRASYRVNEVQINPNYYKTEEARNHILNDTIGHEIAHHIDYRYHGKSGHGPTWKSVMRRIGLDPSRCHNVDVEALGKKKRIANRVLFHCGCTEHHITPQRVAKMLRGVTYRCTSCREPLMRGPLYQEELPVAAQTKAPSAPSSKKTKKDLAREIYMANKDLGRGAIIKMFMDQLDMGKAGAGTYYQMVKD